MINLFLMLILIVCVITDVKSRKIYNKVIYPALLLGFGFHFLSSGWEGLSHSFIGFLIGFALLLIPYMLGGMGAGDVKLLALIGALKGGAFVFESFIYMALIGGVIALGIILFRGGVMKSLFYSLINFKNGMKGSRLLLSGSLNTTYPYGVAIAGGAVLCMITGGGFL